MHVITQTLLVLGFVTLFSDLLVNAAMDSDVDRLVNDLRRNYSVYARPPRNQSIPLTVNVTFSLNAIREFDEVNDKFSVIGNVIITWIDDRLTWDPSNYGGTTTLLVDNNVFWTPPIFIQNSIDEAKKIGAEPYWKVNYYYYGIAVFYPGNVFSVVCIADVRSFPWDKQECFLLFGMIAYTPDNVKLEPFKAEYIDPLEYFFGNALWDVESVVSSSQAPSVTVFFTMKRKPLLSIINIIVPILLMSFLNIMVFLIPAESGERISFCLTVLLAIAVFLTLVSDSMPKSATSIAFLSYYLVAVLALSIVITIVTIVNLKFYFQDEAKEVPHWLQSLCRCLLCRRRNRKTCYEYPRGYSQATNRNQPSKSHNSNNNNKRNNNTSGSSYTSLHAKVSVPKSERSSKSMDKTMVENAAVYFVTPHEVLQDTNARSFIGIKHESARGQQEQVMTDRDIKDSGQDQSVTWKTVSYAFDRIFFVFSAVLLIAFTSVFFIIATR